MSGPFYVIHHDCDIDHEQFTVFGTFAATEDAEAFIVRQGLSRPGDGGHAFAVIIPPVSDEVCESPAEWDEIMAQDNDAD